MKTFVGEQIEEPNEEKTNSVSIDEEVKPKVDSKIDLDELNTGKRREGQFGAIYWWMVKFGLAIAGLFYGIKKYRD